MPIVLEPQPPLPPASGPEDASELWELLYGSLGFHIEDDEANGFALRKFCEGLCAPLQPVYSLARERDDQKGWAILFDPAECPEEALPYLAQYVGIEITPEMTEAQIRAEITAPTGWRRGQPESVRTAVRRTLPDLGEGDPLVIIHPRTPGPGETYVRTLLSQTPDPDRTERAVREALPAWEKLSYEAIDGVTWADITASEKWETWADLTAAFTDFKDLAEVDPGEI